MNISGNYSTQQRELGVVKKILDENRIAYHSLEKYPVASDGDILVTLANGRKFLIEVKEEKIDRFKRFRQLGIDFISAFRFKDPSSDSVWKGSPKQPSRLESFLNSIDKTHKFKGGKIDYSKSDLWLFFVMDGDSFVYYEFFDGNFMTSERFKNYLYTNCLFTVNNKPPTQLSNGDAHNSAVFYIDCDDATLNAEKIDITEYCKSGEPDGLYTVTEEKYSLTLGDAYAVIDRLIKENVKVNHVITDPPYNISHENNFNTLKHPRQGVDFGEWDKNFDLFSWIPKYRKILDKNGSMVVFCSYRYISFIIKTMEENDLEVKDILVWKKSNPMPRNTDRRYVQDMEFAVWAVAKGAKWTFNKLDGKLYMRSLFETSTVSGSEKVGHPTQKSLKLMQDIIKIHTNENDLIIDPFMGSGTTGIACLNLNRKFIGIELDKNYFNMSVERFNKL